MLLVVLCSTQLLDKNRQTNDYSRVQRIGFFRRFLNPDIGVDDVFYDRNLALYDVDEVVNLIKKSIDFFQSMES